MTKRFQAGIVIIRHHPEVSVGTQHNPVTTFI